VRGRSPGHRTRAGPWRDLPAVRPLPLADRAQERRVRAARGGRAPAAAARTGHAEPAPGRSGRLRRLPAQDPLRRDETALRHRPRVCREPRTAADGRAVRRLDALTRVRMQSSLLDTWQRERKTVVFITHDVDEAVFLADRVVVMGPRPGHIVKVIDVDLP